MSADRRPEKADRDRAPARKDAGRRPAGRRGGLDTPLSSSSRRSIRTPNVDTETFGRWSEGFARFMGTAWFIVGMTLFVAIWIGWNTIAPPGMQFDPRRLNYTLLTLILSLQASYAAPLILLAQNRQADRDRVGAEQDRDRAERALADTEFLAREIAALRIALGEVATRDFVRSELRALLEENPRGRSREPRSREPQSREPRENRENGKSRSTPRTELPTERG